MSTIIKDGTGKGNTVEVDDSNRLQTSSVTLTARDSALLNGQLFFLSTEIITLTSDSETAVVYFTNGETSDLLVTDFQVFVGPSTGGSGVLNYKFSGNPTGGTMLSTATDMVKINLNAGQSTTLYDGAAYRGFEGATLTGGGELSIILPHSDDIYSQFSKVIVPKGGSIGIFITPPSGNTEMKVSLDIEVLLISGI